MAVEMKVKVVTFDPSRDGFVVLLSDLENTHALPIWIGPFEANAIALKLRNTNLHRPMTHDLIRNILAVFDSEIVKIEVMDFKRNIYYAQIHIKADGKEITIDSRPSDAIAVALAAGAPIYVNESVLSKVKTIQLDKLEEFLENLNPEDFKYKT
ncbi:MAG: bifunctional nuclease family protein [Nitrososphaeria archaeon]|nr:bifunctional nuclease family protein [Nitrososphaeria archaeon]NIN52358.1 bifunctional nuclease family protein [Nitrososphaeria archaeon]NIQ32836.1 bifunctional nuclease family protein [Nitrososphaeria archaeon]